MSSYRRPNPRLRRRFGFAGIDKREGNNSSTVDDILDSMNRRTALSAGFEEEPERAQYERLELTPGSEMSVEGSWPRNGRKLGKAALAVLAFAGAAIVWSFSSLSQVLNLGLIGEVAQDPALKGFYSDPVRLAATVAFCLVPIMVMRRIRRRNNSEIMIAATTMIK